MKLRIPFVAILIIATSLISSATIPAGYYDSANGKNKRDLLVSLFDIVGDHTVVSYSGLWDLFKESDVKSDGYIWDMYSTSKFTPGSDQCGNYNNVGDCYNREHSMPKSWFNDASPMYSDAFHIYPTDGKVNGQRSNYPFGECSGGSSLASYNGVSPLGKLGTCTFSGYTGIVFEPDDEYKGDFARTYFYMATAYQDLIEDWDSPMLAGNDYPCFTTWSVNLLLKWHRQDPVSNKEINRNEVIYKHQKNRNPYIDHPELAEYIWGDKTAEGWIPGGTPTPIITQPSQGETIDMGVTHLGSPISTDIVVKGNNISTDLSVTLSNTSDFAISKSTLKATDITSINGASLTITYNATQAASQSADLTISNNETTVTVKLTAVAYDGIPAKEATDITESGFTANWIKVSDDDYYTLSLYSSGKLIDGYPIDVPSANQSYNISGLASGTEYTYTLSASGMTSNAVNVTTLSPIPSISLSFAPGALTSFSSLAGYESEAVAVDIISENITEEITANTSGNFEISIDKSNWASTLSISPEGEQIYVRSIAIENAGTYTGTLSVGTKSVAGVDADLKVVVTEPQSFVEDFEIIETGGYWNAEKQGSACKWIFSDAGVWNDTNSNDTRSARFGKTSTSSITMSENKSNGAGTITFYAAEWNSDAAANDTKIAINYSTDNGTTWSTLKEFAIENSVLTEYSVTANITGNIRLKIEQLSGKRINIDDIAISDYSSSITLPNSQQWDIFAVDGGVKIISEKNEQVRIYTLDAEEINVIEIIKGETFVHLPNGMYIITLDNERAKKVIIK